MKIKPASEEYLEKAQKLTEEESDRLLSRMSGKPARKLTDNNLTRLEALAIQLTLHDDLLSEWRENMHAIREQEEKKAKVKEEKAKAKEAKQTKDKIQDTL